MYQIEIIVHMTSEVHSLLRIEFAREPSAAVAVEQHVPLVGMIEGHREGAEKDGGRHATRGGPVDWLPEHAVEHAAGDRVRHLEHLDDVAGGKRHEGQLTRGPLDHRMAPGLEDLLPDVACYPKAL